MKTTRPDLQVDLSRRSSGVQLLRTKVSSETPIRAYFGLMESIICRPGESGDPVGRIAIGVLGRPDKPGDDTKGLAMSRTGSIIKGEISIVDPERLLKRELKAHALNANRLALDLGLWRWPVDLDVMKIQEPMSAPLRFFLQNDALHLRSESNSYSS